MIGALGPPCDCHFCAENTLEIRLCPLCSYLINVRHIQVLFQIVHFQRHSPGIFKLDHCEHVVDNVVELRPELILLRVERSQALFRYLQYVPFAPPMHSLRIDLTYSHLHSSVLICTVKTPSFPGTRQNPTQTSRLARLSLALLVSHSENP